MNKQQLNERIRKLYAKIQDSKSLPNNEFFEELNKNRVTFMKLYKENDTASRLDLDTLKIMIILNRRYRFIPFHIFYINMGIC